MIKSILMLFVVSGILVGGLVLDSQAQMMYCGQYGYGQPYYQLQGNYYSQYPPYFDQRYYPHYPSYSYNAPPFYPMGSGLTYHHGGRGAAWGVYTPGVNFFYHH